MISKSVEKRLLANEDVRELVEKSVAQERTRCLWWIERYFNTNTGWRETLDAIQSGEPAPKESKP